MAIFDSFNNHVKINYLLLVERYNYFCVKVKDLEKDNFQTLLCGISILIFHESSYYQVWLTQNINPFISFRPWHECNWKNFQTAEDNRGPEEDLSQYQRWSQCNWEEEEEDQAEGEGENTTNYRSGSIILSSTTKYWSSNKWYKNDLIWVCV